MENLKFEDHVIYDLETYPNIFSYCAVDSDGSNIRVYEISDRINETEEILDELRSLKANNKTMVGFNSIGFDYNLIHHILNKAIKAKKDGKKLRLTASSLFKYAQKIIDSYKGDGFGMKVRDEDIIIPQIDLYLINHFNNKAKATSLKTLEFNMRSENIEDLPYPVGSKLEDHEKDVLLKYNKHDVMQTLKFYNECLGMIQLRIDLTEKYGFNCMNLNDAKIGASFFMKKIEEVNPEAFYSKGFDGRKKKRQTKRDRILLRECIFDYVKFQTPTFKALHNWFNSQVVVETNGVFSDTEEHLLGELPKYCEMIVKREKFKVKPSDDDLSEFKEKHPLGWVEETQLKAMEIVRDESGNIVKEEYFDDADKVKLRSKKIPKVSYYGCYNVASTINVMFKGFRIDYGLGGLHGAMKGFIHENDEYAIKSADVASMYPNVAIANRVYPEHLGEKFCDSYEDFYNERKKFKKGTPENLAIKLGLNATYGSSNDKFSPFYDPMYTMKITVNGQLTLSMLMERICLECDAKLLMANSDGFEVYINRKDLDKYDRLVKAWEDYVGLEMEVVDYKSMYIRDVNNYYAIYTDGNIKQKGAYEWRDLAWHKNMSSLVIPMAVEHEVLGKGSAEDFIKTHKETYDFMLRTKVPRSCKLVAVSPDGSEDEVQNICRYYPSVDGVKLVKLMPNEDSDTGWKRLGISTEWNVTVCNDMKEFNWGVNYDYYLNETRKLLEPFENEISWE